MTETPEKSAGQSPPELLDGSDIRIGLAVARFNSDITFKMRDLCLARLSELGVEVNERSHLRDARFLRTAVGCTNVARSPD